MCVYLDSIVTVMGTLLKKHNCILAEGHHLQVGYKGLLRSRSHPCNACQYRDLKNDYTTPHKATTDNEAFQPPTHLPPT